MSPSKRVSSKLFYDEKGSKLFEKICQLEEYYLTRTEQKIYKRHIYEIAQAVGPQAVLIEFGSGNSKKIEFLLSRLKDPVAYMPIDISTEILKKAAQRLRKKI